jgi:hypothetical protein
MDRDEVVCICQCGLKQTVIDLSAALSWCASEGLRHGVGTTHRMEIVLAIDVKVLPGLLNDGKGPAVV